MIDVTILWGISNDRIKKGRRTLPFYYRLPDPTFVVLEFVDVGGGVCV